MNRAYSFMSGEFKVSMPAVFSMRNWQHTSTAERLIVKDGKVYRERRPGDEVRGVILLADVENKSIEKNNYEVVINQKLPCWPNPQALLKMLDRHDVLKECIDAGFIDHPVLQVNGSENYLPDSMSYPFVIKTGNVHRGEQKYLVKNSFELPEWSGIASIEPYFEGTSVRALVIGDKTYGIRVENETSWIKNSSGADVYEYELSQDLIDHARNLTKHFNLEMSGVDYIVNKDGFHLLEINYAPGVAGFDHIMSEAKSFFKEKMRLIESI